MISPVHVYTGNIIQTEHFVFRNIYVKAYTYMYITACNQKKGHGFERNKGI